jgi:hypothetical protein
MALALTIFLCIVAAGAALFVCFLLAIIAFGVLGWAKADPDKAERAPRQAWALGRKRGKA